jgi:putative hydroxymethylpyrimidine transport system substrate-binding protein
MIRPLSIAATLAAAATLTACGAKTDVVTSPTQQPVRVVLDYLPNANHVGIYSAQASGEFAKVGLDVELITPTDPSQPLKLLASGGAELAISYEPEVLIARDKGAAILAVGAIAQRPLTSLMSANDKTVDPRKLEGAKIGTAGLPYQDAFLDQILSAAGVDTTSIKKVDVGFNLVPAMLSRRVDATLGAFWNIEGVQLRLNKKQPRIMPVDRAGIPPYDELVLVARNETVSRNGAMIRRFIGALQRGTKAARANPAAGIKALRAAAPKLSKRDAAATVAATLPILFPAVRKPFGWQEPSQWQIFADWMKRNELLARPVDSAQAFTNEFLPGEGLGPQTNP